METYEVYDYIEEEIAKIPSDQDPITINEDPRWHELIEEAVAAKTQDVDRLYNQLLDDEPYCRRDDENNWIEGSSES